MNYGVLPTIGQRIRRWHPWLDGMDCQGTVSRIEPLDSSGLVGPIAKYGRNRVHLVDCTELGKPVNDTYMDTLAESWEPVVDV